MEELHIFSSRLTNGPRQTSCLVVTGPMKSGAGIILISFIFGLFICLHYLVLLCKSCLGYDDISPVGTVCVYT